MGARHCTMAANSRNVIWHVHTSSVSASTGLSSSRYGRPAANHHASMMLMVGMQTAAGASSNALVLGNPMGCAIPPT